ncbi:MAG: replicative DNA helicase [Phycisphaeraceae bacterium]|nr:MAG: replicative DNA helicase [Phycisphaeraceae bacterium]
MTSRNGTSDAPGDRASVARRRPGAIAEETLEKLFGKLPPHSEEAEIALLGSLMLDASVIGDIIMHVSKGEQFYSQKHAQIFQAMLDLHNETRTIDLVPLTELLKARGVLESAEGTEFLVSLAEAVPSARNAVHYAKIVADRSRLRRLISTAGEIMHLAFNTGESADSQGAEIVDTAEQMIFEIASEGETQGPEKLSDLLKAEIVRIEMQAEGKGVSGTPTGFSDFDEMTGGLQPGEMVILAARPSMGKTALSLNMAEQIAFGGRTPWSPRHEGGDPAPVGFFSLEMSREALVQRLLSARSGINAHKIRTGELGGDGMSAMEAWKRIHEAAAELYEAPLFIDDSPGLTILQLRAKARRMAERHGLKAIVIDYLQLLTAPGAARESRQVEVSTISRQIKALARELRIPVLCLAQLNRGAEQRERNRPRMSDLRESGSIEQDADVVMLLHREAYYHKDDEEWLNDPDNEEKLNLTELIIAKQRNGPTGVVKLTWDDSIVRFKNHDWRHASYAGGGGASYAPSPSGTAPSPPPDRYAGDPPEIHVRPTDPGYGESSFAPGRRTGPVDGHRDGGGPEQPIDDYEDDDLPPF